MEIKTEMVKIKKDGIPTSDEAWKMYNFINDWKAGHFGICDLNMALFGYYENYKSN